MSLMLNGHRGNLRERLEKHTRKTDGCWLWTGAKDKRGYGRMFIAPGKYALAHRVAWMLANGREIPPWQYILHSCDMPPCVNPAHLRQGTAAENTKDCIERGRFRANGRLTAEQVVLLREMRETGHRLSDLANLFGISANMVCMIANRRAWRYV